jgi:type II secretory pathway pseudopilin PulG
MAPIDRRRHTAAGMTMVELLVGLAILMLVAFIAYEALERSTMAARLSEAKGRGADATRQMKKILYRLVGSRDRRSLGAGWPVGLRCCTDARDTPTTCTPCPSNTDCPRLDVAMAGGGLAILRTVCEDFDGRKLATGDVIGVTSCPYRQGAALVPDCGASKRPIVTIRRFNWAGAYVEDATLLQRFPAAGARPSEDVVAMALCSTLDAAVINALTVEITTASFYKGRHAGARTANAQSEEHAVPLEDPSGVDVLSIK